MQYQLCSNLAPDLACQEHKQKASASKDLCLLILSVVWDGKLCIGWERAEATLPKIVARIIQQLLPASDHFKAGP